MIDNLQVGRRLIVYYVSKLCKGKEVTAEGRSQAWTNDLLVVMYLRG